MVLHDEMAKALDKTIRKIKKLKMKNQQTIKNGQ